MQPFQTVEVTSLRDRRTLVIAVLIGLFASIIVSLLVYLSPERQLQRYAEGGYAQVSAKVDSTPLFRGYATIDRNAVNYVNESKKLEAQAATYDGQYSVEAGVWEIMRYDALTEIDRQKNTDGLKSIANDTRYPAVIRSLALNFLASNYEFDAIPSPSYPSLLFAGENFGAMLTESKGDSALAERKLNEWSYTLFPNPVAAYRIALWYAGELYRNPNATPEEKQALTDAMNTNLHNGDLLFSVIAQRNNILISVQAVGLMYELKARANYLSGGDSQQTKQLYEQSFQALNTPPVTAHQVVYMGRALLYYAAFLMREHLAPPQQIQSILRPFVEQYSKIQEPSKRNVRTVSRLIAARDSTRTDYPSFDFNETDIENVNVFYPEFGKIIAKLNLRTYVIGHPLEKTLFGTSTSASSK